MCEEREEHQLSSEKLFADVMCHHGGVVVSKFLNLLVVKIKFVFSKAS